MCLEFTNTKISNNHKLLQPSFLLWLFIPMMTLKLPSSSPIGSSKFIKFCNYCKAPYRVPSYCQSPYVNLFDKLFC